MDQSHSREKWKDICISERMLYENIKNKPVEEKLQYTKEIYEDSKQFVKCLSKILPKNATILDYASSGTPWFSYLCAENGMKVFSLDFQRPLQPEVIESKKITYIHDDANNLSKYKKELSDLDFIYCRNFSPPQKLLNWYDLDFIKIWKTMLELLNDNGVIYWIQMTNGTGRADSSDHYFANHTAKYFRDFFNYLELDVKIAKYGYMSFKVAKNLKHQWNDYCIQDPDTHERRDLYKDGDYGSLIKHYALQLQSFYEKNRFELNHTIEITGNRVCSKIVRILLLDNFRYHDARIVGESDIVTIKIRDEVNLRSFTLSNIGYQQDKYFITDEQEDKRFTTEFLDVLKRSL